MTETHMPAPGSDNGAGGRAGPLVGPAFVKGQRVVWTAGEEWFGVMGDGTFAPKNTDSARLDWYEIRPGKVRHNKTGARATGIEQGQPGLRAAIDAAMELERRELVAKGRDPQW
jgi:hypothetical protein